MKHAERRAPATLSLVALDTMGSAASDDTEAALLDPQRLVWRADTLSGERTVDTLPAFISGQPGADAIRLIDVLWLERGSSQVAGAFEVEHTTSIYSGIVRLLDLALGPSAVAAAGLFLVAPDAREADVREQIVRPAFSRVRDIGVRFLPYSELERHREAMARFGAGMKSVVAVSRELA